MTLMSAPPQQMIPYNLQGVAMVALASTRTMDPEVKKLGSAGWAL
jgi:hypothetical protein